MTGSLWRVTRRPFAIQIGLEQDPEELLGVSVYVVTEDAVHPRMAGEVQRLRSTCNMSNATEREYVEAAAREFCKLLESLVAKYRRHDLDVYKVLGDPAEFGSQAVRVAARGAPGHTELPPPPASE